MHDKVAIITGASRGIGLAIASELVSLGYSLGITARTLADIEKAASDLQKQFPNVKVITAAIDVTDAESTSDFVSSVCAELGNVSVLVNNAGDYRAGTSSMPSEEIQKMMDINFHAATRFIQAALPYMKKSVNGYIFNVASICGVEAFSDVGGYNASKFALVGYSSALSQELAPLGIKVTALCPGWVNTRQAVTAPLKPEEMIQPNDIALTVRYLLSLGPTASVREVVIRSK
ncbi:MAG: SDR family NAD(P)-dependent oxidoreductase [Ignavibacteria bacterium]|nr:SDR family NAD(P)-dependent oxidoreductase [Ignavibacteria bacterium]